MGKCFSCFHVHSTEPLPSNSELLTDAYHPQNKHQDLSQQSNNHSTDISSFDHSTSHQKKQLSVSLSNGSANHFSKNQLTTTPTSATAVMGRNDKETRRSVRLQSKSNELNARDTTISENKLNALFELYKDKDCTEEDCILAEGIETLCEDLGVKPDDVRILVLAWKLDAQQMCRFTRQEFVAGLKSMQVDSVKGIQCKLPELVNKCRDNSEDFKSLYRFTFKFGLDSNCGQRILPLDMAIILWRLVLSIRNCDDSFIFNAWLNFLSNHTHVVRGIPRDTWNMFLNFYDTIGNDLSKYDDTEAWPSIFDDFVEYQNDQTNQNTVYKDRKEQNNGDIVTELCDDDRQIHQV